MPAPLIDITGVSRSFGDVVALDNVSLQIQENEFFALLGPSGCGKTTLLRVLAGFEQPDAGRVTLDGVDLLAQQPNHRPVNLMFQSYALFPHMSVERNVAYGLERERRPKDEVADRVAAVLRTVGLTDKAASRPNQLSGGQRQRVALARAIVKRPRLLLLDEPLSALDRKVRVEMQLELKRLQHEVGITFVVVTHDQQEAMSMADRIALMNSGRVEQVDTPIDLYQQPATLFVADFIGSSNRFVGSVRPDHTSIEVAEIGTLHGRTTAGTGITAGSTAALVVRPEDITLRSPDAAAGADAGSLHGTVLETEFLGGTSRIAVSIPGHSAPVFITCQGTTTAHRGLAVDLSWPAQKAVILPIEG